MERGDKGLGPLKLIPCRSRTGFIEGGKQHQQVLNVGQTIIVCITWTWHIDAAEVTQEDEQISHGHDIVSVQVPGTRAAFKFACSIVSDGCRVVIASVCIGASGVVEVACAESIEGDRRCVGCTNR